MSVAKMEAYCEKINKILWDPSKADDLCARAASLVEKVAEGRFERDTIRTQAFTERVIAQCKETG